MDKKRVAIPLVCHGHSRPIVDLFSSLVTPDGFFLVSASKGMIQDLKLLLWFKTLIYVSPNFLDINYDFGSFFFFVQCQFFWLWLIVVLDVGIAILAFFMGDLLNESHVICSKLNPEFTFMGCLINMLFPFRFQSHA